MATYLVTGATGFLGRHFMERLLQRQDVGAVHVLVREQSRDRLVAKAATWPNGDKVVPLVGDISQPLLGVAEKKLTELTGKVDHVVHLAAIYDMTADDATNQAANVDGTNHVIEVATKIKAGRLHHVSSVAVAGEYQGVFTEDMFDEGQELPSPYHATKFEAERLVRAQTDVPWRVYRPAIVVGHSKTGAMDKIDGPYYFFPTFQRLGALPALPFLSVDIGDTNVVPVDYVADAMDHLIHADGLDYQAFHLTSPRPQPFSEVYNAFARCAGAPQMYDIGDTLSAPFMTAARLVDQIPGVELGMEIGLDFLGIPPEVVPHLTFPAVFDSSRARAALAGTGIEVPALSTYAGVLWRYWRNHLDPHRARRPGPRGPLDGRRVVITGASSGIGAATALKVAQKGGVPLLVARRTEALEEVKAQIEKAGGVAYVYSCDLTDPESVDNLVKQLQHDHEGIDMLVNNAGRSIRRSIRLSYDRFHDFERAMSLNYFAALRLIMGLLPQMSERKFGHIVNISSIGVQTAPPRFSAYVASKAALDAFSRIAAAETWGDGITFTTIHMPLVRTPMIAPTKLYDRFPAISPEQAADKVIDALENRPKFIDERLGTLGVLAYALAPKAADAVLHQAYRLFPDSAAAAGGKAALGAREERLTRAAKAMVRLLPGIHW